MPNKEESQELQELSLQVFKRKYAYKQLLNQGVVYQSNTTIPRRQKLSVEGALHYMRETLRMRKSVEEKNNEAG